MIQMVGYQPAKTTGHMLLTKSINCLYNIVASLKNAFLFGQVKRREF
jgi:hypothetical protein